MSASYYPKHPEWTGYIDDPRGVEAVIAATVFPSIATVLVAMRIWARKKLIGLDDILIVISLCLVWVMASQVIYGWHYGLGRHALLVPLKGLYVYLRGLYWFNLVYVINFSICKCSILLFYRRVFATTRTREWMIFSMLVFVIVWTVAYAFAFAFECRPVRYYWAYVLDPRAGKCVNLFPLYASHAAINIVTDVAIYVFPITVLWTLQVSVAKKIGLVGIFVAGSVVIGLSIARAATIHLALSKDFTYNQVRASIFCTLEVSFGIICANLPAIRSLYIMYFRPLITGTPKASGSDGYSNKKSPGWSSSTPRTPGLSSNSNPRSPGFVSDRRSFGGSPLAPPNAAQISGGHQTKGFFDANVRDVDPERGIQLTERE